MHPRRRIALLLAALAVPCLALAALSYRMVRQDRELSARRAAEEKSRLAEQVRKDALNQLQQIKLRVAAGQLPSGVVAVRQQVPHALPDDPEIERGEQTEFAQNNPRQAAEHYRQALTAAGQPVSSAYARLLLARALFKSGQVADAQAQWRILKNTPLEIADEHGIPFALYAAARLKALPSGILDHLEHLSASALYLLKELTDDSRVVQRTAWLERVAPVAAQLPTLASRYPLRETWIAFGDPPWLAGEGPDGTLLAVPAADDSHPSTRKAPSLGQHFPG